jgi:peptide deformylase
MIQKILSLPDPLLRRKSHKVEKIDSDVRMLITDMIDTMRAAPGVGLAASQIGVSTRMIVIEFGEDDNEEAPKKLYVLINPEIIFASEEKESGIEGCLSVPGLVGEVDRNVKIIVRGINQQGKINKINAEGWLARIFQHEIDHLNGILFPDRAIKIWKPENAKPEMEV